MTSSPNKNDIGYTGVLVKDTCPKCGRVSEYKQYVRVGGGVMPDDKEWEYEECHYSGCWETTYWGVPREAT